ncbi:uncharacterized protein LOC108841545 isoform X2 [Raphanus sativus]|uniref:Uncharacterized protein LOC108841545 isoform X2 n=1 Tax=Raphanus sativus TaxID=3726 RepID=A0A9W3CIZ0_RAPSA|nr:uncharacterized protein LOC108841545 isoform X2 [Raphanus sativus]
MNIVRLGFALFCALWIPPENDPIDWVSRSSSRSRIQEERTCLVLLPKLDHIHTVSFSLSVTADSDGGQEDRSRKVVQIASPLRRKSLTRKMQEMKVMKQFAGILVTF